MCRPFSLDDPPADSPELDDLRADISQLEDRVLGLEHDLELIAEALREAGVTSWGNELFVEGVSHPLTDDQAAVFERLSML